MQSDCPAICEMNDQIVFGAQSTHNPCLGFAKQNLPPGFHKKSHIYQCVGAYDLLV
jgi:hypothetical protein